MLARKRQIMSAYSLLLDVIFGFVLLAFTFLFLRAYENEWEFFLQALTGYPFQIESVYHLENQGWLFLVILFMLILSLKLTRFYDFNHRSRSIDLWKAGAKGILLGVALSALFFYFLNLTRINRSLVFLFSVGFSGYLMIKTALWHHLIRRREQTGNPLEVLLVGPCDGIKKMLNDLLKAEGQSIKVQGAIVYEKNGGEVIENIPILGSVEDLPRWITRNPLDVVCLAEGEQESKFKSVIQSIEETGIELWYFLPKPFSSIAKPRQDSFHQHPLLVFSSTAHYDTNFWVKRTFDLGVGSILIFLLIPILMGLAVIVKFTSSGPIIYKQERTGFKGRPFNILKFRTMSVNAEAIKDSIPNMVKGPAFKAENDPRVTQVGKWMRRFSLDELPQLFNVLIGTMSLVGPRPLPVKETQSFEAFKDHRRYRVLPGITGLWQVSGRSEINDFEEWVRLDLDYIDRWSLWLDLKILFKTIPVVLSGRGAR